MSANPRDGAGVEDRRSLSQIGPGTGRSQWALFMGVTQSRIKAFEPEVRRAMQTHGTYRVSFRRVSMRERMAIVARFLARENPDLCHAGIPLQGFIELIWQMGIRINSKDKALSRNGWSQDSDGQDSEGELASGNENQPESRTVSGPGTSHFPPPGPQGETSYPFDLKWVTITVANPDLPGNTQVVPLVGLVTLSPPSIEEFYNIELTRLHHWLSVNEVFPGERFFDESKHDLWCETIGLTFAITCQRLFQNTLRWQIEDALEARPATAPNARYTRRAKGYATAVVQSELGSAVPGPSSTLPEQWQPVDTLQHEQLASNTPASSAKRPQGTLKQHFDEDQRRRSSTSDTYSLIHLDRTQDANRPRKSRPSGS